MTAIIDDFLKGRKEAWLERQVKKVKDQAEIAALKQQASERFSLAHWLPDAAKRAAQLSMVSHSSKFSHPSATTSSVIVNAQYQADGYLRSGNANYLPDVFGNAAAMDVYKFLSLPLSNGKTVLENLEDKDKLIQSIFSIPTANFEDLRRNYLRIKSTDLNSKTDHLVKQVYFPIGQGKYHLLSILTPSGLLTKVKEGIDNLRFSDETKQAKECKKKNDYHPTGFADIYDLTVIVYGGTQPQNISVLNSQNAGRSYLWASVPPSLQRRKVRLPKTDFFAQCLYHKNFHFSFVQLHKFMQLDINNINIRTAICNIIRFIIDLVLLAAFRIRQHEAGWSNADYYASLPLIQRIWLDDIYQEQRAEQDKWQEEIGQEIARWILRSYEESIRDSYTLGNGEMLEVRKIVAESLKHDKEFF